MTTSRTITLCLLGFLLFPLMVCIASEWEEPVTRAESLAAAGETDSAAVLLTETLARALTEYGESDTTAKSRIWRDGAYETRYFRSLEDAESLYTRALRLKDSIAEEDLELAYILTDLAIIYTYGRKNDEAVPLHKRSLEIKEGLLGPDHVTLAANLGFLAVHYHLSEADYDTADSLYARTMSILEQKHGPYHKSMTMFIYNYALFLEDRGRLVEAAAWRERDLEIKTRSLGPDSPVLVRSLTSLAWTSVRLGRYEKAESLYTRALTISENEYGPDHYAVTYALNGLGQFYSTLGRFAEAEVVVRRSLRIRERELGPDAEPVSYPLNGLGSICLNQGRYAEAEEYYKRFNAINEGRGGRSRGNLAQGLYNLALVYRYQARYAEAEALMVRAISIWEEIHGPDQFDVAGGCLELAEIYCAVGRYAEAESLFLRALPIVNATTGLAHVMPVRAYLGLGDLYLNWGEYADAETYLEKALAISELDPAQIQDNTPLTLESLARLHRLEGEHDEALKLAGRALAMRRSSFADNARALSERDATASSEFLKNSISIYLSCYSDLDSPDEGAVGEMADVILSSKGQVSDGIFERRRDLVEEDDPAILDLAKRLRLTKLQLSRLFVEGPGEDADAYRAKADSLSALTSSLESELSLASASYNLQQESRNINTAGIASLLPAGSVLTEFIRFDYLEPTTEKAVPHYMLAVVEPGGDPDVLKLGRASDIDNVVEDWRNHMLLTASAGRPPNIIDQQEYDRLSQGLYERIWKPIERLADGKATVIIAPDGALNMVAFSGLKAPDGEYLVERHALHHLTAGRDLVRLEYASDDAEGLFALGDPDYGAMATSRIAALDASALKAPGDRVIEVAFLTRNVRSGCGTLSEMEVTPLPGTRREVELVSESWEATTFEPVTACYGDEASEEYFKAEAPGNRVIHLATHGYFLGGACRPEEAGADYVGENPLLLSGLFFAGANLHGEGADSLGAEDGILTAYEVSAMNLEGTELVVLSACETGLGEVKEGEGVYGLRRAFQMAGARTVVSALWPVGDEATAKMMSDLYAREDESLPDAMRRVQLEKIMELRSAGEVDHPFTWGAFIALGDWR